MTLTRSVRLSRKGQLVIPKEIRDALGIKEGEELLAVLEDRRMILIRPEDFARATRGSMKGTWGRTRHEIDRYLACERRSWR
jgi:AbrB family looped-hinge helix DNA binding protein